MPTTRPKAKPPNTPVQELQQMHHSRHSSGRASLKIGDTWCLMHTSATVLLTRPRCDEHISHTAAPLALSGLNPRPGLSYPTGSCCRALPIIPFLSSAFLSSPAPSKSLLAFLLPAHPSILAAHDTNISQAHICRNGAKARPRLVAESFDHAVTHFAQEHPWLPPWCC